MPQNELLFFVFFNVLILGLLALDLGVFHKKDQTVSLKDATLWSAIWIVLSFCFNAGLFLWVQGNTGSTEVATRTSLEFLTGYLIEKALSMDNIFVFVLIFNYFGVPAQYHHKVLFWGVLGALLFRTVFIITGAALIAQFEWVLYIFGAILIYSGWKMMRQEEMQVHPDKNLFIRAARKLFPVETGFPTSDFFVMKNGRRAITSMFLVLITVETTDIIFAVDSIPAVFAITRDPFIVYSSNVFAILGLRSLYFLLAGIMSTFHYLKHGLSIILIFVGIKMLLETGQLVHIPIGASLGVIGVVLTTSIWMSIVRKKNISKTKF